MAGLKDRLAAMKKAQESAERREHEAATAKKEVEIDELSKRRERVANELSAAEAEMTDAGNVVKEAEALASEQGENLDLEARSELEAIRSEFEAMKKRLEELRWETAEIDADIAGLEKVEVSPEGLAEKIEELKAKKKKLYEELNALPIQFYNEDFNDEMEDLRAKLRIAELGAGSEKVQRLKNRLSEVKREHSAHRVVMRYDEIREEIDRIDDALKKLEKGEDVEIESFDREGEQTREKRKKLEASRAKRAELVEKRDLLGADIEQIVEEHRKRKEGRRSDPAAQLSADRELMQERVRRIQKDLDDVQEQIAAIDDEIEKLEA